MGNRYGKSSIPDPGSKRVVQAAAGGDHTALVYDDGSAIGFGSNTYGQTIIPDLGSKKVVQVVAGGVQTVLVFDDGSAMSLGLGQTSKLGHGSKNVVKQVA